jgi:hypothetical protein
MARKTQRSSWRTLKASQVLPVWTTANSNAANIIAQEVFAHLGITDIRTYFQQLRVAIVICAIVGACIGASSHGEGSGLLIGAVLGVVAPAVLIWLGTVLVLACIFLTVYCAAWVAIIYFVWWILGAAFGG